MVLKGLSNPNDTLSYSPSLCESIRVLAGVNTADRSLPISLILGFTTGNAPTATNVDVYVLADALFYINGDGSMSVSV
jgi:hypothetical protein|eukprot:COSAG03_NODE_152_length_11474_cov_37.043077_15_plen_78_part_00